MQQDKTPLERAEILSSTPLFAKVHTESASSKLNQTAPNLDTELHFTCFVEAPEADIRWIARDRDGKEAEDDLEKEREEVAQKLGTGMRLVELDGRRDGPVDHGECKDLLKVSRLFRFCPRTFEFNQFIGCSPRHQDSIYGRLIEPQL
jgi:ubiquitin carboxyl-terminal hydrolase L3